MTALVDLSPRRQLHARHLSYLTLVPPSFSLILSLPYLIFAFPSRLSDFYPMPLPSCRALAGARPSSARGVAAGWRAAHGADTGLGRSFLRRSAKRPPGCSAGAGLPLPSRRDTTVGAQAGARLAPAQDRAGGGGHSGRLPPPPRRDLTAGVWPVSAVGVGSSRRRTRAPPHALMYDLQKLSSGKKDYRSTELKVHLGP
jgi:hypothetical protein